MSSRKVYDVHIRRELNTKKRNLHAYLLTCFTKSCLYICTLFIANYVYLSWKYLFRILAGRISKEYFAILLPLYQGWYNNHLVIFTHILWNNLISTSIVVKERKNTSIKYPQTNVILRYVINM